MHPMWRQGRLRKICGDHKIHVSAYSPLGGPGNAWGSTAVVDHPIIRSIAFKHRATPAQVKLNSKLNHHISHLNFITVRIHRLENQTFHRI